MMTKFLKKDTCILTEYGLPFFNKDMVIRIKGSSYEIKDVMYDSDENLQTVILK